jgi:hypothetical protein
VSVSAQHASKISADIDATLSFKTTPRSLWSKNRPTPHSGQQSARMAAPWHDSECCARSKYHRARSGEARLGSAVVADEVRSLAQQSANAARETSAKLQFTVQKPRHPRRGCADNAKPDDDPGEGHEA